MIYLASPYTHPDPLTMKTRFLLAEQVTAHFLEQGFYIYSPIVHCHAMAEKFALPHDVTYWQGYNFDFIRRSDELWVLAIPGVEESRGVQAEISFAKTCGLEIKQVTAEGNFLGDVKW